MPARNQNQRNYLESVYFILYGERISSKSSNNDSERKTYREKIGKMKRDLTSIEVNGTRKQEGHIRRNGEVEVRNIWIHREPDLGKLLRLNVFSKGVGGECLYQATLDFDSIWYVF